MEFECFLCSTHMATKSIYSKNCWKTCFEHCFRLYWITHFSEYYPTYLVHKRENWKIVSTRKCVHPQIAVHCTVLFTIYFRMNTKQSITCFNLLHLINVFKISDIQYSFCLSMFFNGVKKTVENVREMHFIPIFDFRRKYKVLNHPKHPNVILAKQKCFHFVFVSKMKFSLKPESYMGYKLRIHSLV